MKMMTLDVDSYLGEQRPQSAEEDLLVAVFERVLRDYFIPDSLTTKADRASARAYLFDDDADDGPYSLPHVAEHYGMEVTDIRSAVRKMETMPRRCFR